MFPQLQIDRILMTLHSTNHFQKKNCEIIVIFIGKMNGRNGICEFKSLAKSVELDTEWFRSVTSALPKFATQGGGSIVSFVNPYSDNPGEDAPISDSG